MTHLRPSAALIGAAVCLAALTACTDDESAGTTEPDDSSATDVQVADADPETWESVSRAAVFHWAEDVLISGCMAESGFEFQAVIEPERPAATGPMFGIDDLDAAREFGLAGIDMDSNQESPTEDPNWQYLQGLPAGEQAEYQVALYGPESDYLELQVDGYGEVGIPMSGCLPEAQSEIYGDLESWMRLYYWDQAVESRAYEEVAADPAYTEALSVWSECMRRHGFDAADPEALREAMAESVAAVGPQTDEAWRMEVDAAVAEATCAQESGHVALGESLLASASETIRSGEDEMESEFAARSQAAWANAVDVLRPHLPEDRLAFIESIDG